jgi:repressor LexA
MPDLTFKQEKILRFIERFWASYSLSPTYQEIQEHFGFQSPNAVEKHVQALIRKGFLRGVKDSRGRNRSLVSVRAAGREVPLVGRIAAGTPIEAVENIVDNFDFSSIGIDNTDASHFALTVRGNSMIGAHVLDGDMVVIRKQGSVLGSDMAAVLLDGEATLKYVRKKGDAVELVPANDAMKPIAVDPDKVGTFEILGKVVRVIRTV